MTHMIVIGHGGFGTAIQRTLAMLMGDQPGVLYVDFNKEDDLEILKKKISDAVAQCDGEILFACDLAGGSPFRQCAMLCVDNPQYRAVAGLNISAFAELVVNLDLGVEALTQLGVDTTRETVARFPEKEA